MKKLVLIDFDFTLFKSFDFWQDFSVALAQASGKDLATYSNGYEEFVRGEGRLRLVDYDLILEHAGVTLEQVSEHFARISANKDYLYEDARQLLTELRNMPDYEVEILTFGEERFQRFKLKLVPEVAGYRHNIIQKLKTNFIAETFLGRQGVLIDDKPDQQLPEGWTEIHINRKAQTTHEPLQLSEHIWQITNLADAITLI